MAIYTSWFGRWAIPAHTAWASRRTHNLPHDVLEGGWNHLIAMSSYVPARRGQCLWSPRKSAAIFSTPPLLVILFSGSLALSLPAPEHLHPELFCFSSPFIISPSLSLFFTLSLPPLSLFSPLTRSPPLRPSFSSPLPLPRSPTRLVAQPPPAPPLPPNCCGIRLSLLRLSVPAGAGPF